MFAKDHARNKLKALLLVSSFVGFLLFFMVTFVQAQSPSRDELPQDAFTIGLDNRIPVDPPVTAGELKNGIKYYIRSNKEPANRAEIRLVVNAGSILEDEKQLGLAHLLEHMAFQGTKNFEKQKIIDFMESIGMPLGHGVNAGTSFDQTIYMLQLPTDNKDHLKTAIRILRDWASNLTLDPEEIETERKVVIEEWRQGRGAESRIEEKIIPVILKDSRYAERLPIGTLESISNFKHDDLRRFYKDWYRPDLIAVIAAGDFDTAAVEKLIKKEFKSIRSPKKPRIREEFTVPSHDETLFAIATDPEIQMTQISVYYKSPKKYDWTVRGYRKAIVERLYNLMLNERFNEISMRPDPPFIGAASMKGSLARTEEDYRLMAIVKEGDIKRGFETILVESERVSRFGFTGRELERQKKALLRAWEQNYVNRDSRTSSSHASEMTRSYLTGEHIPGAPYEMALYTRFIPEITLEEVNRVGKEWISGSSRVVVLTAPEKPGLVMPGEKGLKEILDSIPEKDIEPYRETSVEGSLLDKIPEGSKVVSKRELKGELIEWKLANGITVILKPTDFKEDEIIFNAFSPGGTSLASDEDFISADSASGLIAAGGIGKFDLMGLRKKLADKVASVTPVISEHEEGLSGSGSPADLETLFQLIYMRITEPRADQNIFNIAKMQLKQLLLNRNSNPATLFVDTFNRIVYDGHPRKEPPNEEMIDKIDLDKSFAFYRDRFADTGDFIFIFVGSIDPEVIQPLVETYIGALPGTGRKETWKDTGVRTTRKGIIKQVVKKGQEPKSSRRIAFTSLFPEINDLSERTRMAITRNVLETRLRDVIRDEMGGTYSVTVNGGAVRLPIGEYLVRIDFTSDPERMDELTEAVFNVLKSLRETGPKEEEVADMKQAFLRSYETGLEQNAFWLSNLSGSYKVGINPGADIILDQPDAINSVTVESVKETLNKYYDPDNFIQVTLLPEQVQTDQSDSGPKETVE